MAVRIYDIAKKYGLENKEILEKAKSLGIAAAKVPSSMLDKISAGWLEEELLKDRPDLAAKFAAPKVEKPKPALVDDEIKIFSAPPRPVAEKPAQARPQITITATGAEIYRLVQNIINGGIQLNLDVSEVENSDPLRLCLVKDVGEKSAETQPKFNLLTRVEIDAKTKNLLLAAYYASKHSSSDGWVNLAEYGGAIKKIDPTFQPQNFGERSLGYLLRRVDDVFELKNDETNPIVYYVRMKEEKNKSPAPTPIQATLPTVSTTPKLARGKVHNLRLGFGFIMPDDGSENAFFHATDVEGCTIFDLKPGDPVEYEPGTNERGPCGRKVRRITT